MDFAKIKEVLGYVILISAPLAFGWVVGYFVGQSDSEAVILAAVLPVVLSGIGMFFVLKSTTVGELDARIIMVSIFIILFSGSLYGGSKEGKYDKGTAKTLNLQQALEARFGYLQNCSVEELRINEFRKDLDLPLLESSVFCR